jgi:peptidoglycan/LPS O-acetylase OafA/YrhL
MVFINPTFSFYFPFCRFWQMSVGGLIAYKSSKKYTFYISNGFSLLALVSICVTVWNLTEKNLFPGFWALIPTISAALIILAGNQSLFNKYVLSSVPFVFIGKISYPLYLWHWPLVVFSEMFYPEGSTSIFANKFFALLLAVVLSILTYYLVETPLRFRK